MDKIVKPFKYNHSFKVNASKSYAQRALLLSAISVGESRLINIDDSKDVHAMLRCIRDLGADVQELAPTEFRIKPAKIKGIDKLVLNVGESGLALHLLAFAGTLYSRDFSIIGEGTLLNRSQKKLISLLEQIGFHVSHKNFQLPLRICGEINSKIIEFDASDSSQEVSAMLMTFPLLKEATVLKLISPVSKPYIEMTLDIMERFGIQVMNENDAFYFPGNQSYLGISYAVEGDWSSAAAHIVGAQISGQLKLSGLNPNSLQADKIILEVIKFTGAKYKFDGSTLIVQKAEKTNPFKFDILNCPDLFPVLIILACASNGCSQISGIHRLFNKESNRLKSVKEMLLRFGVESEVVQDTIFIHGKEKVRPAEIDSYNDHRIVMAATIAVTISNGPIKIINAESINKSYPTFFDTILA